MTPNDYDFLRSLLKQRSGLILAPDKQYLVESRLLPLVRKAGADSIGGLLLKMQEPGAESLIVDAVDAMTTNETFFFRDKIPFEQFNSAVLPALMSARRAQRSIRIWCSACSTGQEPYSLAIALKEMGAALAGWQFDIIATDIATPVIDRAREGIYNQFEVQRGLPIGLLLKYFEKTGESWQVVPEIRSMVKFRQLNLLRDFSALGMFDLVFCRNVLIYFDHETKVDVLRRIALTMDAGSFLVLGAAETVVGLSDRFKPHPEHRGLYVPSTAAMLQKVNGNVIPLVPRVAASRV